MKRIGLGFPVGLAAAVLLLGSASTALAGTINVVPVLNISGQWSDNIFFAVDANKQSDTFILVNPGVSFDYASRKAVLSLGYQAGLQRFAEFSERDNTIQRFDAQVGFEVGTGVSINLINNLVDANDPLAFDASGARLQQDSYLYNHFSPAVNFTFGGRNVMVTVRYDRVDVDYDTLIDSSQNGFQAKLGGRLGAKSSVNVEYSMFRREFDEQPSQFVTDYDGYRIGVGFDRQLSPRVAIRAFGGYEERKFDEQGSTSMDFDSGVYSVDVVGEFPNAFALTGSVSRRLNDLASTGVYVVDRFNLELRKSFADRVSTNFNFFYQKSDNDQIPEEFNYIGLRIGGEYLMAKFLNVFLGYEYLDRETKIGMPPDFTENRFNFGLSASFGL